MGCPDCQDGTLVILRIKGQVKPYQDHSLLERLKTEQEFLKQIHSIIMKPEKHQKNLLCSKCKGSGLAYYSDGEDISYEPENVYGENSILKEARATLN